MPSVKKIGSLVVKIGVSGTLLVALLWRVDRGSLARNLASVDLFLFLGVMGLYAVCQWVSASRWRILLVASGLRVSMWRLFSFNLVGMFFNNFLPTAIGGDVVRSFDLYRFTRRGKEAVASVFMDRFTGFSGLLGVAAAAAVLGRRQFGNPKIAWLVCGIFAIYAGVMLLLFWERLMHGIVGLLGRVGLRGFQQKLDGVYGVVSAFRSAPSALGWAVAISVALQILVIITFYGMSIAMHLSIPIRYFFIFCPLIWASSMLPSLGGLGVREATGVYFFTRVGVGQSEALGLSFMWTVMLILLSLVGGAIFAFRRRDGVGVAWDAVEVPEETRATSDRIDGESP